MNTARTSRALTLLAFAAVSFSPAFAQGDKDKDKDVVIAVDGKEHSGKIQSEDYAGVVIKGDPIPWDQVQSIQYGGEAEYYRALDALSNGRLDEALTLFGALKDDTKGRKVIRQHALYQVGHLLQRTGKFDEALAAYQELVKAFPQSRYLFATGQNILDCYLGKKDAPGGVKAIDAFCEAAQAAVPGGFMAEAGLLKGRSMEVQGKFADARAAYGNVAGAPKAASSLLQQAQLGQARCLLLEGDKAGAEPMFRKLVESPAPNQVTAGAWNGLGDIYKEQGKSRRDADTLLDALYAYLRGVVQYYPTPGESTIEHERAQAGAVECFKYISDLQQNPEARKLYLDRARERFDLLAKEFPSSPVLDGLKRP